VPAEDPTTRDPLALELTARSSGAVMYVSRPCYHELRDPPCTVRSWTFARYSTETVDSMAEVIASRMRELQVRDLRLIGYSGGGVLAVLIAERLEGVTAVVTIAANLDTDAWATHHGYLPLDGSLNPSRSQQPHPWKELHLQGALDETVPSVSTRAYFARYPGAKQLTFEKYDHVCCWVKDWEQVQERIARELD
jgi:poly(3-hydroxybutyrate) depolymerase